MVNEYIEESDCCRFSDVDEGGFVCPLQGEAAHVGVSDGDISGDADDSEEMDNDPSEDSGDASGDFIGEEAIGDKTGWNGAAVLDGKR